jgi:hypothetical protein
LSFEYDSLAQKIPLYMNCIAGDITIESEEEGRRYQAKIEESLQYQLGYHLQIGDTILTHFDSLPGLSGGKGKRRKSKVFER